MFPDLMLDIETTGTDPSHSAILQIGAVFFNVETGQLDPTGMFNRSLVMPPNRFWDEDTRDWWMKRQHVLAEIRSRAEPVKKVLEDFASFVTERQMALPNGGVRVWGKPVSFDFPFIENYFRSFDVISPFDFRSVVDMRTFIRAKLGTFDIKDFEASVPFTGTAHNALMDSLHQVKTVLECLKSPA